MYELNALFNFLFHYFFSGCLPNRPTRADSSALGLNCLVLFGPCSAETRRTIPLMFLIAVTGLQLVARADGVAGCSKN